MAEGMQTEAIGDVADVTNSTAYISIDALVEEGKLVEERASHLRSKFKELHDRVLQIYNHDNFLLKRARQLKKDLESEKAKVERCGEIARADDASITALKKELASAEHELNIAQEKESMLQVETLELERKKQNLTHEVEDAVAAEEARLRPQIEFLQDEIRGFGDQIEQTATQFDKLKEEREKLLAKEAQIKKDMERQEAIMYEAKLEFTRIEREPERARKQTDIVERAYQTAHKEVNSLTDKVNAQKALLAELEERKRKLQDEQCDLWATLQTNKAGIDSKMRMFDNFVASLETDKISNQHLQQRVQELDRLLQAAAVSLNAERDRLNRTMRDKDQGMKDFKRIDQQKSDLQSEKEIFLKQKETLNREEVRLNSLRKQCSEELEELKKDVDILINNFLKEEISEKRCMLDKDSVHKEIEKLESDVRFRAAEEQALKRECSELSIHREQMSRECSRNQTRVLIAKNELKIKEVVVREMIKRHQELTARLNQLTDMYGSVKREKSAKAHLISSASQTMSETQEKIKILENELEVLRRESLIKDHDLAAKRRLCHEVQQSCKNQKVEVNKWEKRRTAAKRKEKELKRQMKKLNSVITLTEDEMLELKKNYEDAVENRNYTGIQLIDRNDELCILYEKANIQENIMKRGQTMLNQRVEEIRNAAIELSNLQREIEICQRVLPQVRDMEEDLAHTLEDLDDERWRADVLERDLTDPNNPARWRKLGRIGTSSTKKKEGGTSPSRSSTNGGGEESGGGTTTGAAATSGSATAGSAGGTAAGGASPNSRSKDGGEHTGPSEDMLELQRKQRELEQRLATVNEKLMEKDLILEEVSELSNELRKQALSGRDFTLALAKKVIQYQFGIKDKTKKMKATLSELSMVQASAIKLEMDVQRAEEDLRMARERLEQGMPPTEGIIERYEREQADKQRKREMLQQRKEKQQQDESQGAGALMVRTTAEQRPNAYIPDADLLLPKPYGRYAPFRPTLEAQFNVHKYYRKSQVRDLDFDDDDMMM